MWIEIFRTGTFTDQEGRTETFTEVELDKMVELYNESVQKDASEEAPLVKGHPADDSPAHGWVERLARRGDKLYAKLKSLSKEIVDEVQEGRYRRVSVSLYPNLMLRHIGLLGAETPAVKGLTPVSFVEFLESSSFEYTKERNVNFAELRDEIRRLEEENSRLSHQNQALLEQLQQTHTETLARSFSEFIAKLNTRSEYVIVPPSKKNELMEILQFAAKVDMHIDSSGKRILPEGVSLLGKIKEFLLGLHPIPINREYKAKAERREVFATEFDGKQLDEERLALHLKAKEAMRYDPKLSYEEALFLVSK
ncbi:MAG: hypothetical protein N2517_08990 [Ignavibacteria bacterium]|nr:hypothetical protein [Ignavibacteria bacterium]